METFSTEDHKQYSKLLLNEQRFDGRKFMENRKIQMIFGNEPGNVETKVGKTHIITKTTAEIVEPKKNKPSEGFLKFKLDFQIISEEDERSSQYTKKYSNEISKLLERIIKESKAIDAESLCLITGKRVWSIKVDICVVNNDGNLIDAVYLCAICSLLHFRKPQVQIESQDSIRIYSSKEKNPQPLSIHHIPIAFTFCLFHNGKVVVCDPLRIEEEIMDGRITLTMNIYKDICNIHKPGGAPINPDLLSLMVQTAQVKVSQMTKFIREILQQTEFNNLEQIKEANKIIEMEFPTFQSYQAFQQQQQEQSDKIEIEQQEQQQKIDIEELENQLDNRKNI